MTPRNHDTKKANTAFPGQSISILHIENNEADIHLITEQLQRKSHLNYQIQNSNTLSSGIEKLQHNHYDIILLDLSLPDSTGINSLKSIRHLNRNTPIIVLTGSYDENIVSEMIHYGAQDYVHKDEFSLKIIDRTIRYAIERKKTELELELLAHHDPLTKLSNRSIFMDRLKHALDNQKRQTETNHVVVMLLDLDKFKMINDTMGHAVGDALLIQVANRLQNCVRDTDTVARLGGDEFIILFENVKDLTTVSTLANKIINSLAEPFLIDNRAVFTSCSIGVSSSNDEKEVSAESILKNSDIVMYSAKNKGGNQVRFFTRELQVTAQIRNNLENNLRVAIDENQLQLYFQPQVDIQTQRLYGAEALVRWNHPEHGIIPPNGFIPVLDETGLIIPATEWIITHSLTLWEKWLKQNIVTEQMHVSINIPPKFIRQQNAYKAITNICNNFSLDKSQIEFELTEDAFIDITPQNLEALRNLKHDGFRLAIDDFGSGYSSLGYLKAFPIDCLKLDRIFVKDIVNSPKDAAIAEAMIDLCKKIGVNLIAEGVDTQEKLNLLQRLGCKIIQGFYFSKPLPADTFIRYAESFFNKDLKETLNKT